MKLVRYRDAGMNTYTYFFVNEKEQVVSPFFDSDGEAWEWFQKAFGGSEDENK